MKCLICPFQNNVDKLLAHHFNLHNIERTIQLLNALFEQKNVSYKRKCNNCNQFFYSNVEINKRNVLKHFQIGRSQDKLLNILKRQGFTIYTINFEQHNDSYNFFDSEKLVNKFLKVVDRKFVVGGRVEIQCAFLLTNFQPPQDDFFAEIIDQRSWLTDVYPCVYFNEFVTYRLKQDILKRVIINGLPVVARGDLRDLTS